MVRHVQAKLVVSGLLGDNWHLKCNGRTVFFTVYLWKNIPQVNLMLGLNLWYIFIPTPRKKSIVLEFGKSLFKTCFAAKTSI